MSQVQQHLMQIEQLRREASFQRMPVSAAVAELAAYIAKHREEDCLLEGFSNQKANPYRERNACEIL